MPLMSNSGLESILETIYAKNSIDHIMSGKIIYRAIRGHIIVDSVLNGLLLSKVFHDPISTIENGNELDQNNALHVLYSKLEVSQKAMMDGKTMEEIPREPLDELEKLLKGHVSSEDEKRFCSCERRSQREHIFKNFNCHIRE